VDQPDRQIDANRLLSGLVDILANGNAVATQFERLGRDLGISEGAPAVVFLSGVKKILRELPEKAFTEKHARIAMVDAVQDALDQAIETEESMNDDAEGENG
jgi:type III secretion protein W